MFDSDLECTYTIICSLVKNSNSPEDVLEMVKAISSKVVQQPNDKASLRLKMYDPFQLICLMFFFNNYILLICWFICLCIASSIFITFWTTRMLVSKSTWSLLRWLLKGRLLSTLFLLLRRLITSWKSGTWTLKIRGNSSLPLLMFWERTKGTATYNLLISHSLPSFLLVITSWFYLINIPAWWMNPLSSWRSI